MENTKTEKKIDDRLLKPYEPNSQEELAQQLWEKSGLFNPDKCVEAGYMDNKSPVFSMVLPPPNVTGTLHIGSAYMLAIEDTLARYKRMKGHRTLWIPGTDHAAIATQAKVEKEMVKKEGKNRHDLGRDEFLKRVDEFAKQSHDHIVEQVRKTGCSVDWTREAFTLDEKRNLAVRTAFKKMYDDGIIYRGHRIVNWDPKGQTTISDDEIVYKEEKTKFYYFKYGPFVIGTSRPETKFGDKHVVMHPDDKRYSQYKNGETIALEWINGPITATIIKDEAIDMSFGTGVMTITPWHDATDFQIAERHNLEKVQIIDKFGRLLPVAGEFAGMKITEARPKIVEKLKAKGLLVKEEDYTHNVATAERTEGLVEPQIMNQWFIDVNKEFPYPHKSFGAIKEGHSTSIKKLLIEAVRGKLITIVPDRFEKVYFNWIDNLRDWCISRQIWYGHRIPVWYKEAGGKTITHCGLEAPKNDGYIQDEDTLDTWFSSGLWTFSTLGWPDKTKDLETYHPTSILETGYDILFFWVARMILMSSYLLGEVPFKTVYLHGLVRDKDGKKISKSLGNNIDPIEIMKKYGADAMRMALLVGTGPGNDTKMSEDKFRAYKLFSNKLWNIARFVQTNTIDDDSTVLSETDKIFKDEFDKIKADIESDIESYRLYLAAEKIYHYIWHTFADIIIEESKPILQNKSSKEFVSRNNLIKSIYRDCLKLLHPFMPHITEILWQIETKDKEMLMVAKWPK